MHLNDPISKTTVMDPFNPFCKKKLLDLEVESPFSMQKI